MIDTHAHLNIEQYEENIDQIIQNAQKIGVNKIIVVGMDKKTSLKAIQLANQYDMIYATVGIHPSYVDNSNHNELNELYNKNKVVAVGEIGLDFYWREDNKKLQEQIFEEQIQKAIQLNLPVIIHARNSFLETYNIVKKYKNQLHGVFHCFSSNLSDAQKVIDLGFYIGIDGPITFKNKNQNLVEIVKNIDLKHILIETDSPYLTPEPYRGKTNQPANVYYVAKKIAEIKKLSIDEVINTTSNNAKNLFNLEVKKNEKNI